jgi:hypothetical protein
MKRVVISLMVCAVLAMSADLPVKQVILYKHGIGFFERSGTLAAGESARLDFNASDMNDVLKSLTLEERGGGKISGLRYDSMDPLSHRLAEFPFAIGDDQSLAAIFGRLQGARVELKFGTESIAGSIVGGRVVPGTDKQSEREFVTLLLDSGDIRTLDLGAASGIRFTDPKLQANFKDYLLAVAAARSKDKRSVYIDSTDARQREISASYTIPTAVWKSSYRLMLSDKGQPTLEGWAIVDNTTGEDWNKVQLSLVSGRPISFVSQLYAPKYVQRFGAELADDNAARPVVHDMPFATWSSPERLGEAGVGGGGRGGRAMGGVVGGIMPPAPASAAKQKTDGRDTGMAVTIDGVNSYDREVSPSTIVASASAGELGELFEYRISQPVTIRKDESAMLPFLQQTIEGRKLLIYSDHSSQHPTNATELTNTSGKTLDGGPITVYDGGAYGGEALMETLKAGDKRLISYAVDLGTRITDAFNSKGAMIRELHANRGVITTKMASQETRTYTIRNVDAKAKTLILEHPLRQGYTLLSQKASEKTAAAYRFEIQLAANSTQEFAVAEERVYDQTFQISSLNPDSILIYVRNRNLTLSDATRRQLQSIADQKTQIVENDRAMQDTQTQVNDLTRDEDRIRQNINSLNNVSSQQQLVQNYAKQLDAHEQQLAQLRDRQSDLGKKKLTLQTELDKLIEGLTF